jgi:hypothetical protein
MLYVRVYMLECMKDLVNKKLHKNLFSYQSLMSSLFLSLDVINIYIYHLSLLAYLCLSMCYVIDSIISNVHLFIISSQPHSSSLW